jgi:zinc transport system substrate-binding protein
LKKKIQMFTTILIVLFLAACSSNAAQETKKGSEEGILTVYTTIYPLQYFTERIGGGNVTIKTIVPPGADAHTVEVDLKTMTDVAESDAFIHTGTGLESYADSVADSVKEKEVLIVNSTENVNFIASNEVESHSDEEEEENHDEEKEEGHDEHADGLDVDPHVWLDPERSIIVAENIKNALVKLQPEKNEEFENNFADLKSDLEELDNEFENMVNQSKSKTFIVSHSAYGYWVDAYGLNQIGISGLSPTDEPSQKQLVEVIELIKENNLKYIFFEPNLTNKVSEIVKNETGTETLNLNNLEAISDENIENNEDYFDLMQKNIEGLQQALN